MADFRYLKGKRKPWVAIPPKRKPQRIAIWAIAAAMPGAFGTKSPAHNITFLT